MSFLAFSLVIGAALMHAIWNLLAKRDGKGALAFGFATTALSGLIWLPVVVLIVALDPGMSPFRWSARAWVVCVTSAAVHTAYLMALFRGYAAAPLSVVYPVARGVGPLISAFVGAVVFAEPITLGGVSGVVAVVGGVFLLTAQRAESDTLPSSVTSGIYWGGITGITVAGYTVVDGYAIKEFALHPITYDYVVHSLRALLLLPFALVRRAEVVASTRECASVITVIAVLSPAAYALVLFAVKIAPLSHVAPAREVSLLIAAFLGGRLLQEGHIRQRVAAAGLIATGVILYF